jgi:hypothetical protein
MSDPTSMAAKHRRDPKVYISYRREDRSDAGRLYDRLTAAFGSQNIFIDVVAIAPGSDFADSIVQEIRYADVVLVLIGPEWSTLKDPHGRRRIDDPRDFIGLEVATALASDKPVIPVLINNARMPKAVELPEQLRDLSMRNAAVLGYETFRRDVEVLIEGIRRVLETHSSELEEVPRGATSVFLSHSNLDRDWVESAIASFLTENGIKVWYAEVAISTSAQWEREILKGMEACEWFSLVVSPFAAESDWVKDELFWAMENRPTRIVPIIKQKCDLYKFHIRLPRIQHVDFTDGRAAAKQKLLAAFAESK